MAPRSGRLHLLYPVVIVAAAVAVGAGLFLGIRAVRRAARRAERTDSLRQIGLALESFDEAMCRLPPAARRDEAGRPLSSWRFQLVPYIEATMLGIDFGDPWDDPANRCLSTEPVPLYCWAEEGSADPFHTTVMAITGPGTAFDGDRVCRLADLDPDTILAIEIADSGTHWMEPGDLPVDEVSASIVSGLDGEGVHVLFADGSVWFLTSDVPLDELKKFLTIDGARQYDREEILGPYARR